MSEPTSCKRRPYACVALALPLSQGLRRTKGTPVIPRGFARLASGRFIDEVVRE